MARKIVGQLQHQQKTPEILSNPENEVNLIIVHQFSVLKFIVLKVFKSSSPRLLLSEKIEFLENRVSKLGVRKEKSAPSKAK